jgi:hypothetical protein
MDVSLFQRSKLLNVLEPPHIRRHCAIQSSLFSSLRWHHAIYQRFLSSTQILQILEPSLPTHATHGDRCPWVSKAAALQPPSSFVISEPRPYRWQFTAYTVSQIAHVSAPHIVCPGATQEFNWKSFAPVDEAQAVAQHLFKHHFGLFSKYWHRNMASSGLERTVIPTYPPLCPLLCF